MCDILARCLDALAARLQALARNLRRPLPSLHDLYYGEDGE